MIALLALAAAGKAVLYDTLDPDCFWHLRVAEQLQRDGIGPIVDDISFASIKTPWTPYSWLAELGMKAIWDLGGFRAAIITQALMMAGFVIFVALAALSFPSPSTLGEGQGGGRGRELAVIISTVFAMFLSLPYLSFRPVTFVIVLLALCTWLLLRDRKLNEQSRAVWLIVPLTAVMTNCHFFAAIVPLWVMTLLIGAIWEKRNVARYGLMLALASIACAATPMLPGAISSIWHYQFSDPMVGGGIVAEFRPFWSSPVTVILLVGWLLLVLRKRTEFRTGELAWVLIALLLYIRLGRLAPIFAPIAAAMLARSFPLLSNRAIGRRPIQIAVATIVMIGLVRIGMALPDRNTTLSTWLNRHGPEVPGYPCAAADFVASNLPSGRIINEFTWGGYLAWRLGEQYQVFLDGRTQLYSPQFWQKAYLNPPEDARLILSVAGAQAAVVPVERSRFRSLLLDMGWTSAYRDERAEVLFSPAMNASINP